MKKKLKSLNQWNKGLAALHAIQAVLILVIASDFSLPVTVNYLTFDNATETLSAATNELFRIEIALLVFTFLALSAIFHVSIATWYRKTYEKNLKKNINRARWYEYSLSASTMMVAIAMLSGIYDLTLLISFFVLTAVMNLAGLIMESANDFKSKAINWFSYNVGSLAGIVPWIGVGITLWASGYYATGDSAVPTFVYIIFFSIFLAFSIFALNMYLQYKKVGPWKDYLYGERMYMILSLVAKSLLAWQVFAGTLQPA